ncbi:MAG: hypothetical protein SFU85_08645 [Candidatus Methylacidiphilales bacterium]|nr:hypothetical protein [Candidatus Methylacidiphilales bacterium]
MSGPHHLTAPAEERFNVTKLGIIPLALLVAGLACLAVSVLWGIFDTQRFAFSWLIAFMFVFTICAGTLFWTLLHHALDADWSVVVRRLLETIAGLFRPWLAILFLPVVFLAPHLYTWWTKDPAADHLLHIKSPILNHGFFWGFAVFTFVFFGFFSWLMKHYSTRQDVDGSPWHSIRMRQWSCAGIILFALTITFAGIMWIMALDYHWFSTMWGVYIFAGTAGSSMATLILVTNGLKMAGYLKGVVSQEHNHIMGKLLLAFTIFWAYIAFSQYMLYYYANIPEETIFFMHRNEGTWYHYSIFLVFGRFFFPFLMLLTQPAKKNPLRICFIAAWILVMHFLDLYWMIMPQFQVNTDAATRGPEIKFLLDLVTVVGMVLVLVSIFLRRLPRSPLFPLRDPRLYESVTLVN